jgi:putative photosynthetic complex assembly protein 2
MLQHGLPALVAVFAWWFCTGVILHLGGLRRETFRWSMAGASLVLAASLAGLWWLAEETSVAGAYLGFAAALLAWAWIEVSFLIGGLTGPRQGGLPPGLEGWPRLRAAAEAVLWHELAIAAIGVAVIALSWGAANQVGMWTYLVLWVMRCSAKLNVFLGVRNLGEAFLPDHLRYLPSYFRRRAMNPLLPASVLLSTAACVLMFKAAAAPASDPFLTVGLTLAATLLALAIVEHLLMVLPIPAEALWRWGLRSRLAGMTKPGAGRIGPPLA